MKKQDALKTVGERFRKWTPALGRNPWWPVLLVLFIVINAILLVDLIPEPISAVVGQVAKRDVVAPRRVINRYRTEQLREEAAEAAFREAAAVAANYVIDPSVALKAEENLAGVFAILRSRQEELGGEAAKLQEVAEAAREDIATRYGLTIGMEVIKEGLQMTLDELNSWEREGRALLSEEMRNERISDAQIDIERARFKDRLEASLRSAGQKTFLAGVVPAVVMPNLSLDWQKVERIREQARRQVQSVYVEQGQIIVREGDLIQPEHYEIMRDLGLLGRRANYFAALGLILLVTLLLSALSLYIYQQYKPLLVKRHLLIWLALIIAISTGLIKCMSLFSWEGMGYLIPTAMASMLVAITLDSKLAVMVTLYLAATIGIVMGQDMKYVLLAMAGGLTGVFSVSRVSQRMDLTRAGLVVGLVNFLTLLAMGLFRSESFLTKYSFLGFFNGLLSSVLVIGILPYAESLFRITSSIRLLELSNANHPLLRKLLLEVPGTYHHSLIVGNLAEAAAEAIGADPLLARVGAQYHDVGKTKRPLFFIENQYGMPNPHDKLTPSLSTLIITSHVKDGVELARSYKLPEEIINIIEQHHGRDMVKYFYHKAVENAGGEQLETKDFSYSGPLPQTREAAIVMLADACEAAVRSMEQPTPGKIDGMVRKIIKERLHDGQLDESDITFKDLDRIANAFVKVLTGIYHRRIEYPGGAVVEDMQGSTPEEAV
ncbi:MAG TPA: HDIG domain-containing protein [Firmicutes bacterium]|nr:HDIG domain-containing protein [Bacillota bacterium]